MSYTTVQSAVQTILRSLSQFSDADITLGDYRILDAISTDCAVLIPGSFDEADIRSYMSFRRWDVLIDLFYVYRDDGTSWTNFTISRDNVITGLENYPTLDSTSGIIRVRVSADGDAVEVFDEDARGPFFITQRLRVAVNERADLTGGEYA